MILLMIFTVLDMTAERFHEPFFALNEAVALRSFGNAVNSPDSAIHAHPEDYALYCVGTWNGETGEVVSEEPRKVASATSLITQTGLEVLDA